MQSPLLGLMALNHQLSKHTSQRLNELPVLRDTVSLRDSELSGSQRKTEELKGQYEREVDTLRRNTSMLQNELDHKDREIRGLHKDLDAKQEEVDALLEEVRGTKLMLKKASEELEQQARSHETEVSTLRLRHEQELFILKKMSSGSAAKKPARAKP
jgi:peptidoglycan hydrolase CwlO-like protein